MSSDKIGKIEDAGNNLSEISKANLPSPIAKDFNNIFAQKVGVAGKSYDGQINFDSEIPGYAGNNNYDNIRHKQAHDITNANGIACASKGTEVNATDGDAVLAESGSRVIASGWSAVAAQEGSYVFFGKGATGWAGSGSHVDAGAGAEIGANPGSYVHALAGSIVIESEGAHVVADPGATILQSADIEAHDILAHSSQRN